MNRDDVLKLFQAQAGSQEKTHTRGQDIVLLLAEVVARCGDHIAREDVDALIRIGGTLVKHGDTQSRARDEVAATMRNSHRRARADRK